MESPDETNAHQRMERGKKQRWVRGKWSRQMSFKKSSLRKVEREHPLGGVARKAREKDLG
jgi:hypothetical protein